MMKGTNYVVPHYVNFLPLLRPNVRRGTFRARSYNFFIWFPFSQESLGF